MVKKLSYIYKYLFFGLVLGFVCVLGSLSVAEDEPLDMPQSDFVSKEDSVNPWDKEEQVNNSQESKGKLINTITLDVKRMDIIDVLKILADEGGFNFSINGNVTGRVTLFLKDVNVFDALDVALVAANLAYHKQSDIIYIMTDRDYMLKYGEQYDDRRQVRIFTLKQTQASKAGALLSQVVSSMGKVIVNESTGTVVVVDIPEQIAKMQEIVEQVDRPLETKVFSLDYTPVKELEDDLAEIITKGVGVVKIDEISNQIAVIDYPEVIEKIDKVLKGFDVKPMQVLIDAKIIELKPSKKYYAGIDWEYWINKDFKIKVHLPAGDTNISIGAPTDTVSNPGGLKALLQFIQSFGETKVLSSPQILVMNNQDARIATETKKAYITFSENGTGDNKTINQKVEFVPVGVILEVTPTINKHGYVTLKIKPEVSSAKDTDITVNSKTSSVPIKTSSEAETTVIVKDGTPIIMGGLKKVDVAQTRNKIPVLGDLPFFGSFFRNTTDTWEKTELVILLTPYIISGDKPIEKEIREKMNSELEKIEPETLQSEIREQLDFSSPLKPSLQKETFQINKLPNQKVEEIAPRGRPQDSKR